MGSTRSGDRILPATSGFLTKDPQCLPPHTHSSLPSDPSAAGCLGPDAGSAPDGDGPTGPVSPAGPVGRLAARIAGALTGRRSAWVMLAVFVALLVAMAGGLRGAGPAAGMDALPETSESSRAAAIADTMEGNRYQPVFAVVTRDDGAALTAEDTAAIETLHGGPRRGLGPRRRAAPCPPRTARPISS